MLRRLLLLGVFLAMALLAGASWWAGGLPGAGALHQLAPMAVPAGTPFEIKVLAGAWGEGPAAHTRYRDWSLQLLRNGKPFGAPVSPATMVREGDRLAVRFQLTAPVLAEGLQTELAWQLHFVFDGQVKQVAGPHVIAVNR